MVKEFIFFSYEYSKQLSSYSLFRAKKAELLHSTEHTALTVSTTAQKYLHLLSPVV